MKKTAKISDLFLAANNPPGQKLYTAANSRTKKLYTSYSYMKGLSNPSGYREAIERLSSSDRKVRQGFRNSKKRAKTRADSDFKRFWQDSNLNQCKEWAYFLRV